MQTKYMPVVTVDHDPETGEVLTVQIEWSSSQQYIEQIQDDGSELPEDEAEELATHFDAWLASLPSVETKGTWTFHNHAATTEQ